MHTICHVEYEVKDLAVAQAFYEGLFGWSFRQFTDNMSVFGHGDTHIGGLMKTAEPRLGKSPMIWFDVEDIDAAKAKATSLGGTASAENMPVPGVGLSTEVYDLDGNAIGLVQFVR